MEKSKPTFVRLLKPLLARTLLREGSVRRVLWGPSRGIRYHLFTAGLAPLYGGWERNEQELMVRHVKGGSTAYDLGANHGIHTLLLARLVGDAGRVYAFEPVPENLCELRKNIALNNFANVKVIDAAVADQPGTESFGCGGSHATGHLNGRADSPSGEARVKVVTLDDQVFAQDAEPPDFIKIDVEGAESRVLAGARRVLETYRPILLIALHTPEQDRAVGRTLADLGYEAYRTSDGSKVASLSKGWPDPDGIWGECIAFPCSDRIPSTTNGI
jgi:FkbM family methyltransferase